MSLETTRIRSDGERRNADNKSAIQVFQAREGITKELRIAVSLLLLNIVADNQGLFETVVSL